MVNLQKICLFVINLECLDPIKDMVALRVDVVFVFFYCKPNAIHHLSNGSIIIANW